MALKFQKVKVSQIIRETPDAVTVCFRPEDPAFRDYIPGQYLTLRVNLNGKNHNRAYSLCTSPYSDSHLGVTVKVTPGGLISTYLNQQLKEGDALELMPPMGNFVAHLDGSTARHFILIGAGSGITPLMSILKSVLDKQPQSRISLLYGNRNEDGIIFNRQLQALESSSNGRLEVLHTLSQPSSAWSGLSGRLLKERIQHIIKDKVQSHGLVQEFYICGPSGMMSEAAQALKELGISDNKVHQEHFSAALPELDDSSTPTTTSSSSMKTPDSAPGQLIKRQITVIFDGEQKEISVLPSQSVLDAALDADLDPPYACMIGSCCTCKAKLMSGKVIMDDREGLTDQEIADGFVLTCQSHPMSDGVVLNYDVM